MPESIVFYPGKSSDHPSPLARFLPPIPHGIVTAWLKEVAPPGSWILDPFGTSPTLSIEAAQAGYKVLVSANNPITRFLIEMAGIPATKADLSAALADLASAPKGDERIEPHLQSLYQTTCEQCGESISVDAYLWERGALAPYGRIYTCPRCGDTGEKLATREDIERAMQFSTHSLHWARALERIAPANDPDRVHAEEALSVYVPRAVYALFTLLNKIDGLSLTPQNRMYLQAIMLTTCDLANTLWAYPTARERPKQLTTPPRFREHNVWGALERSINYWAIQDDKPVISVGTWPQILPDSGGIAIFVGRLRELVSNIDNFDIKAVITALPRPNQAFWTLSALWSGWLWGMEAVGPFKSVLRRRRYDWAWHTSALFAAFSHLSAILPPATPVMGIMNEFEVGFATSALVASEVAGFTLDGISARFKIGQVQIHWKKEKEPPFRPPESSLDQAAQLAIRVLLTQRNYPADYDTTYTAGLSGIIQNRLLRYERMSKYSQPQVGEVTGDSLPAPEYNPADDFTRVQNKLKSLLGHHQLYDRLKASDSPESGYWWLNEIQSEEMPLFDRVEIALVRHIQKNIRASSEEIDQALCSVFTGLLTPDPEFIQVCLESYGTVVQSGTFGPYGEHSLSGTLDPSGQIGLPGMVSPTGNKLAAEVESWQLRPEDAPSIRRMEIESNTQILLELGIRLGYITQLNTTSSGRTRVEWLDIFKYEIYHFFPIASAIIGEIMLTNAPPARKAFIVLPGSRANLVAYKLRIDPRLAHLCEPGSSWGFIKFRQLRWLMENPLLDRESFDEQLGLDPLTYTTPQLRLI